MTSFARAQIKVNRGEWSLWFQWLLATSMGWALAEPMTAARGLSAAYPEVYAAEVIAITVIAIGCCLVNWWQVSPGNWWMLGRSLIWAMIVTLALEAGRPETIGSVLQWLVLRNRIPQAGWWVLASSTPGLLWRWGILGTILGKFSFFSWFLVQGPGSAILQMLVLWRAVYRAGWWPLASIGGLVIGVEIGGSEFVRGAAIFLGKILTIIVKEPLGDWITLQVSLVIPMMMIGAIIGAITGIALIALMRFRKPISKYDERPECG